MNAKRRRRREIKVTKVAAARAQLESAIWLWFTMDDPISVHALAVAAHDCYHALGSRKDRPSFLAIFIKSQSKQFQRNAVAAQNFFKHGFNNLKGSVQLDTLFTSGLLVQSLFCHRDLPAKLTPLMALFWCRFLSERPDVMALYQPPPSLKKIVRDDFKRMSRHEFLKELLPMAEIVVATAKRPRRS